MDFTNRLFVELVIIDGFMLSRFHFLERVHLWEIGDA